MTVVDRTPTNRGTSTHLINGEEEEYQAQAAAETLTWLAGIGFVAYSMGALETLRAAVRAAITEAVRASNPIKSFINGTTAQIPTLAPVATGVIIGGGIGYGLYRSGFFSSPAPNAQNQPDQNNPPQTPRASGSP